MEVYFSLMCKSKLEGQCSFVKTPGTQAPPISLLFPPQYGTSSGAADTAVFLRRVPATGTPSEVTCGIFIIYLCLKLSYKVHLASREARKCRSAFFSVLKQRHKPESSEDTQVSVLFTTISDFQPCLLRYSPCSLSISVLPPDSVPFGASQGLLLSPLTMALKDKPSQDHLAIFK